MYHGSIDTASDNGIDLFSGSEQSTQDWLCKIFVQHDSSRSIPCSFNLEIRNGSWIWNDRSPPLPVSAVRDASR